MMKIQICANVYTWLQNSFLKLDYFLDGEQNMKC